MEIHYAVTLGRSGYQFLQNESEIRPQRVPNSILNLCKMNMDYSLCSAGHQERRRSPSDMYVVFAWCCVISACMVYRIVCSIPFVCFCDCPFVLCMRVVCRNSATHLWILRGSCICHHQPNESAKQLNVFCVLLFVFAHEAQLHS